MAMLAASNKNKEVELDDDCRRQLRFWELALLACNGRLSIPDPDSRLPPWAVDIYTVKREILFIIVNVNIRNRSPKNRV